MPGSPLRPTERPMNEDFQSPARRYAPGRTSESHVPPHDQVASRTVAGRPTGSVAPERFEPPISALGPLFGHRLERIHNCRVKFSVEINSRPTRRVLGGYYRSRRLVRIYSHDSEEGRRPIDELFDTFLHEVAHHLEYTEPFTFGARSCRRVPGLMHSRLFWRILGELKWRWSELRTERHFDGERGSDRVRFGNE
jgi:hypothetical protein